MGCDIHMRAEMKRMGANGKEYWGAVGPFFKNAWHDPKDPPSNFNSPLTVKPYDGRNYDLFGMLANVRNGSGFAGCVTGRGFVPIAEPRGFPEDMSYDLKEWDGWGDHSASWLSLAELLAYDWQQVTTHYGVVNSEQYQARDEKGKPVNGWCGGVGGRNVRIIDNAEMDALIARGGPDDGLSYYTSVEWQETYAESAGTFLTETIPALQKIADHPDVLDVRIVFNFDS